MKRSGCGTHGLRVAANTARFVLGRLAGRALARLLSGIQPRVIYDRDNGRKHPYLSRYYLLGKPTMPDGSPPFDDMGSPRLGIQIPDESGINLYVHHFHRSDDDLELHSHPWSWALSFVIAGGYREERRVGDRVATRTVRPLSFNFIRASDLHRVDLIEADAWTLFLVGPKVGSWGFWCRRTGAFTPWREFLARKQGEAQR